jgi:hypothetical protein
MKKNQFVFAQILVIGFILSGAGCMDNKDNSNVKSFKKLKTLFEKPPVEYSTAPLWVWNDDISEKLIDEQLQDMKFGGIHGVFIHPRPGLITPYLSERWFELCRHTVDKAKELGMEVWLYDENSYPSGFAGGHVPAKMPESYNQGQGLLMEQVKSLPERAGEDYFLILKEENGLFKDITSQWQSETGKSADYFLFKKTYEGKSPWFGGYSYVDLLFPGVTEKFIEETMTGYKKAIGDEFGKSVPGIFTDEPNIKAPGGTRWTPTLFTDFEKRWGYDLRTSLPSVFTETGEWQRVRHNYYTLLLELFIERWSKPWFKYCTDHNLAWTGHYWEHGWPDPGHGGDNMAMYAWHQMPAIDILMNQYSESVSAQFGNVRAVKELRSAANQMGRKRTLSETYGAGGWDLRFEDMKRIGDWEFVLGVNFLNQHLSYITLAGARKRDHPQSFSYHDPWWKYYHTQGDYFARLSLAMSAGEQSNTILVLEPTTTAWMYFSPQSSNAKFAPLGPAFQKFVFELEKLQIEYDLGSENIIKDNGKVVDDQFVVGHRSYHLVILPPYLENLDQSTVDLLKEYMGNGGQVLSFAGIPNFIEGKNSEELISFVEKYNKQWHQASSLKDKIATPLLATAGIRFAGPDQIQGNLLHHRRELTDGQLVFLVNTDIENWSSGSFAIDGKSAQELNLVSGRIESYPWQEKDGKANLQFDLPPAGSLLLFISPEPVVKEEEKKAGAIKMLEPEGDMIISRLAPNALILDYVNLKLAGQSENDLYFFAAADKVYREHGFDGNPWSRSVQYKSEILDRNTFPLNSGFEAEYLFTVQNGVDIRTLQAVAERPANWQFFINGKTVEPNKNDYWLDRAFAVYNIGEHITSGKNVITLKASPMTVHSEIEPIYIIGDFDLVSAPKGWVMVKSTAISLGSWAGQGLPFYSDGVSYSNKFNLHPGNKRFVVKLTDWLGCVAEVQVNKKSAGTIAWQPSELDITDLVREGENEISVIVYGTLKNLLGPHHIGPLRGSAWPASFEAAPITPPAGVNYDVIDYGLFDPFLLIEAEGDARNVYYRYYQVSRPEILADDYLGVDAPLKISIITGTPEAEIYYTLDGTSPDRNALLYRAPLSLPKSAVLKVRAFKKELKESPLVQKSFYILNSKINGLNYAYYEGQWDDLPPFDKLEAANKGRVYDFDLKLLKTRQEKFAVRYNGFIYLAKPGSYDFYVNSNDGSKLFIGDREVVDNSGSHGPQERQGKIKLQAGIHPLTVDYFDSGGGQLLEVSYQGPGIVKQPIPADILRYKK